MIFYLCPDSNIRSSGVRFLYQHVEILNRHGYSAAILHIANGFSIADMPSVPVRYLQVPNTLSRNDYVVIPEGCSSIMPNIRNISLNLKLNLNLIVIALNWRYIYKSLPDFQDWRAFNVQKVLVNSFFVGDMIRWAMNIPVAYTAFGVNPFLYKYEPETKVAQVSFIQRKVTDYEEFRRILYSRNPAFIEKITWRGMSDLSEADYAREIRQSRVFLNLSHAEGFPASMMEAMRAGTLVAGYNSVGGQRELIGSGPEQNCVLAENLDYVTLAQKLEPVLLDVLNGDMTSWNPIIHNGIECSKKFTPEEQERTVILAWEEIPGNDGAGEGNL
jgi:hypothetical protein